MGPSQKETSVPDEKPQSNQVVETDLEPSEGLEFESNGDGTCTITGIGTCTDQNIVIPLANYTYEVDENAFQYGEFTAVNIIGGSSVINKSAFSSCEDLTSVVFTDSILETEEYVFYSCEDLKSVTICENAKSDNEIKIDDRVFQYCKRLETVNIGNGNIAIGEAVFSGCADNLTIIVAVENYTADAIKVGFK